VSAARTIIGALLTVGISACAAPRRPTHTAGPIVDAPRPDSGAIGRSDRSQADTVAPDPVALAERDAHAGQPPRTVVSAGATIFPFGHGEPTVTCAILRVCGIALEPGERILATATGDSERWEIVRAASGPDGGTPLLLVKPTDCALTTNLVVATDRRVYAVALASTSCASATRAPGATPPSRLTPLVRFWYPDRRPDTARADEAPAATWQFTYHWTRDARAAWTPVAIFDDGRHVHIVLPGDARRSESPVLWERTATGDRVLLNYTVRPDGYITDRVFARATLELPDGSHPRRIEIVNDRLWDPASGADR
jgi:type IV secretion system protein VirB9